MSTIGHDIHRIFRLIILATAGLICAAFLLLFIDAWLHPIPNRDEARISMEPTIAAIESYRIEAGCYPGSLKEIEGFESATVDEFPLIYAVFEEGQKYCVSIGDYAKDDFEFSYCSEHGWYFDT